MRWLAGGSSLVLSFVLCLNYFPSLGEEIFRTCFENTGQAVSSRWSLLFPSPSYSDSKSSLMKGRSRMQSFFVVLNF